MKHELKISVRGEPSEESIVKNRTVILRNRLMKRLFGERHRIMVIVPGESIRQLLISELDEEDGKDERT